MSDPYGAAPPPPVLTCYRHHDRRAGVTCQRCDRPICASCMIQASVGFQCPECVSSTARSSPVMSARSLDVSFTPYVSYALIAINVVVFVIDIIMSGAASNDILFSQGPLFTEGHLNTVHVASGDWYRLLSSGFLHFGIVHLLVNMVSLYILGPQLERLLGAARFGVLYLAALFGGALGALLLSDPRAQTVGASGAIFGLLGAALAFQLSNKINIWQSGLGGILLINVMISFIPGISFGGHLGGLVGGALTGWVMFELDRRGQSTWAGVVAGVVVASACMAASIVSAPQLIYL